MCVSARSLKYVLTPVALHSSTASFAELMTRSSTSGRSEVYSCAASEHCMHVYAHKAAVSEDDVARKQVMSLKDTEALI